MSKYDIFFAAQRKAYDMLNSMDKNAGDQALKTHPKNITAPATLIQELPLTPATNLLTFHFGVKSPQGTNVLNNFLIGENDIAVVYGVQLLIGQGALITNRIYRAFGPSVQDNAPYNSELRMQLESNIAVKLVDTLQMRKEDGTKHDQYDGAIVLNPLRTITGRVSTFDIQIVMPDVSTTVFTNNLFVSMRLLCVLGQATM